MRRLTLALATSLLSGATALGVLSCGPQRVNTPAPAQPPPASESESESAGYMLLKWDDPTRQRPVWVEIWYPSSAAPSAHNYGLGRGEVAQDGARLDTHGKRPWVLFSHGSGGSANNYAWLAEALAQNSYIVVGVNHYGESRLYGEQSVDSLQMFRWWDRVQDLHFAVDQLRADQDWGSSTARAPVGMGHSSGGASLLAAAGAPPASGLLGDYCLQLAADQAQATQEGRVPETQDLGCEYAANLSPGDWEKVGRPPERLPEPLAFDGLWLMEPAMGPAFVPSSLARLELSTEIVATRPGDFLPYQAHAVRLSAALSQSELLTLDDSGGHFVFLNECTLPLSVLGMPLCQDSDGVKRGEVHRHLQSRALSFLATMP